jgi:hypothetical protein
LGLLLGALDDVIKTVGRAIMRDREREREKNYGSDPGEREYNNREKERERRIRLLDIHRVNLLCSRIASRLYKQILAAADI